MFEDASRLKFRFDSPIGPLTTEDLWDIPLTSTNRAKANLDDIARTLDQQLRSGDDVSFVHPDRKSDSAVRTKFDLVKYVIDYRVAAAKAESDKKDVAAKKQRLLAILADREDDTFKSMSIDELRKAIEAF